MSVAEVKPPEVLLREIERYVRRRVPPEEVEDLTQDIMVRVFAQRAHLRHAERLGAWMHRVAHNAVVDAHRKRGAGANGSTLALVDATPVDPEPADREERDARKRLAACLRPMIEQLAPRYAEALRLTELEGLTQREAAARVGVSWSGMKSRVQRGRAQLLEAVLACCEVECDARGRVIAYRRRR